MNTNTNTAPAPSPEPMRLLFLGAMEWGRFFWAQRSVPDITLREVSQDFADKAALSTAAQPPADAWAIAESVRTDLDRQSCPGVYMDIAVESIVKHLAAAPKPHVQIPKENVHDKGDVAKKTEQLDASGPAVATKEMLIAAVKYVNGGDIYEKLPLEVLEIEESIYGEIYWVMAEAAPKATKAEPVQRYRMLVRGEDRIEADDEYLQDDAETWEKDPNAVFKGSIYYGGALRPARRAIQPAHKEQP